jgi:hypothetical protein
MSATFFHIIQRYFKQDKIFYITRENVFDFWCYNSHVSTPQWYCYIFFINSSGLNNIPSKIRILYNILTNNFISESYKEEIFELFSKFQKIYNGFARFSHIYKFKKSKVQVNTDLCLNTLDPKKSNVFCLYQNNAKYYFSASDLIHMFTRNLSTCINFVPHPIITKNPYNNVTFNDADLYNIYFFLRWSGYVVPELLQGYFMSNFIVKTFSLDYEFNIVNTYIKNFIYNSHHDILYPIYRSMISYYKGITKNLLVHKDFPKQKLMNIMKPYMHLHYIGLYSINGTFKQCDAEYTLRKKLKKFVDFNPSFGRQYIVVHKNEGKRRLEYCFNDKHINFYGKKETNNNIFKNDNNDNNDIDHYHDDDDDDDVSIMSEDDSEVESIS